MGYVMRAATLGLATGLLALGAETPDAAPAIMQKMAANTTAATEARRQYVYHQRIRSSLVRSNGQPVCKEAREYTVIPQEQTTEKKLVSFSGECLEGKQLVPYPAPTETKPGLRERATGAEINGDRESIAGLVDDLANDPKSRDGIPHQLFPLGSEELDSYKFTFRGETTVKGRRAYDISFVPVWQKGVCGESGGDCRPWKGEVWVDAEDYQPVRIDTELAKSIPWGVRVFMGIDVQQLGFSLTYERVANGVWFPATFGTEFRIKVLWGYKRTITMSMENSDFRRTDAQSTVQFEGPEQ